MTSKQSRRADEERPNITAGGDVVGGDKIAAGGDVVGRDKTVHGDEVHGDKITVIQRLQSVTPFPVWLLVGAATVVAAGSLVVAVASLPGATSPTPTPSPTSAPPSKLTLIRRADHPGLDCLAESVVLAIAYDADYDVVWAGFEQGLLRFDHTSGQWACADLPDDFPIRALAMSPDGEVWAGGPNGLVRLDPDGALRARFSKEDGMFTGEVTALAVAPDGRVWVGHYDLRASAGVSVFDADTKTWSVLRCDGDATPFGLVTSVAVRPSDGSVWLATDQGLRRIDRANGWTSYRAEDGTPGNRLPDNAVNAVSVAAGGKLWIGTGGGIAILDDRATPSVGDDEWQNIDPPNDDDDWLKAAAISLSLSGFAWLGTQNGVWSAPAEPGAQLPNATLPLGEDLDARYIYALASDEGGGRRSLWIGTDVGLYYWRLP